MSGIPEADAAFMKIEEILRGVPEAGGAREELKKMVSALLETRDATDDAKTDEQATIEEIRDYLRDQLPVGGEGEDEVIMLPKTGDFKDDTEATSACVDCFLYPESVVDEMVDMGKMQYNYCLKCGSRETKPLTFYSHSLPMEAMHFLFTKVLNGSDLAGKTLLDVGSRTGVILYYAQLYHGEVMKSIQGIEISKYFCKVQQNVLDRYFASKPHKIELITGDVFEPTGIKLMEEAEVVILHNVFQFFSSEATQILAWGTVKDTLKPGTIMVTVPSLESSLEQLGLTNDWATPVPFDREHIGEDDSVDLIHKYIIQ